MNVVKSLEIPSVRMRLRHELGRSEAESAISAFLSKFADLPVPLTVRWYQTTAVVSVHRYHPYMGVGDPIGRTAYRWDRTSQAWAEDKEFAVEEGLRPGVKAS